MENRDLETMATEEPERNMKLITWIEFKSAKERREQKVIFWKTNDYQKNGRQARDHNLCLLKADLRKEHCPKYAKSLKNAPRKSYPIKNPKYFSGHLTQDDMQMTCRWCAGGASRWKNTQHHTAVGNCILKRHTSQNGQNKPTDGLSLSSWPIHDAWMYQNITRLKDILLLSVREKFFWKEWPKSKHLTILSANKDVEAQSV